MSYLWIYAYLFVGIVTSSFWQSLWGSETTKGELFFVVVFCPLMVPWILGSQLYSLSISINQFLRAR